MIVVLIVLTGLMVILVWAMCRAASKASPPCAAEDGKDAEGEKEACKEKQTAKGK